MSAPKYGFVAEPYFCGEVKRCARPNGIWVLTDFGYSVPRVSGVLNSSSNLRMTIEICAPELVTDEGRHDERIDIWAFGCVAYASAKREYPFHFHDCVHL